MSGISAFSSSLLALYLWSLLWGCVLGAVYDCLRLTRVFLGVHYSRRTAQRLEAIRLPCLSPRKKRGENPALGTVVFFEDLFFFLGAGISMILLFYQWNNGKIRPAAILLLGMGFLLYRATLGRLVMLFSEVIVFLLETGIRYLLFFLFFPIKWILRKCSRLEKRAACRMKAVDQKRRRAGYTASRRRQATRYAGGLIPRIEGEGTLTKKLPKGKVYAKNRKEAVRHKADPAHLFDPDRGGVHPGVFKQRHGVQPTKKGS